MTPQVEAYLSAAESARTLIAEPDVARSWTRPSALEGLTVGGLAAHLGWMIILVDEGLACEPPEVESITALQHYERVPWATAHRDADINVTIREWSQEAAAKGHAGVLSEVDGALAAVRLGLPTTDPGRRMPTPAGTWALPLEESLLTRMVEIAVHSDDLAVSVGLPTPELPDAVIGPVLHVLALVSAHRHGQPAVLRVLTRAERARLPISAFGPSDPDDRS